VKAVKDLHSALKASDQQFDAFFDL